MKLRVVVGIPSYNEADSISNVVAKVDSGLSRLFDPQECVILNVDSGSHDETKSIFYSTETVCRKEQIDTGNENRGKGKNLWELFKYSSSINAEFIATVDADLLTIEPDWVCNLLRPIVDDMCDYVCPLYRRNKFEGSTTNHMAVPMIYSLFNVIIRQPVGGEFALGGMVVDYLLEQHATEQTLKYGIDAFMTCHAIGGGFRIGEAFLGRKFHKPSFPKMKSTFSAGATSTFECGGIYGQKNMSAHYIPLPSATRSGIDDESSFPHKDVLQKLCTQNSHIFFQNEEIYQYLLGDFFPVVSQRLSGNSSPFSVEEWAEVLYLFASKFLTDEVKDSRLEEVGSLLFPIFVHRVADFWIEVEALTADETETLILTQAETVRKKFQQNVLRKLC